MSYEEDHVDRAQDQSVLIELIIEAKNHMRHCQELRAPYLNLFLVLSSGGIASLLAILSSSRTNETFLTLSSWAIGIFVWIIGNVTMLRAELWSAHILHNLFISRRLTYILQRINPLLRNEGIKTPKLTATNEFTRPPWSLQNSVDTFFAIILTGTSSIPFIIFPPFHNYWFGVIIGICLLISPYLIWFYRSRSHKKSHKECCFVYPFNQTE